MLLCTRIKNLYQNNKRRIKIWCIRRGRRRRRYEKSNFFNKISPLSTRKMYVNQQRDLNSFKCVSSSENLKFVLFIQETWDDVVHSRQCWENSTMVAKQHAHWCESNEKFPNCGAVSFCISTVSRFSVSIQLAYGRWQYMRECVKEERRNSVIEFWMAGRGEYKNEKHRKRMLYAFKILRQVDLLHLVINL
jgi:hypothetical protein